MSYIRFDNGHESVELSGSERRWMARVCNGLALTAFAPSSVNCWTRALVPRDHWLRRSQRYVQDFETWLTVGSDTMLHPATGEPLSGFGVILNTALRLGSEEARFMARIHGQCEVHAYIRPESCNYFADLVESGLRMGLYRQKMGWEGVAALLRRANMPGTRGTVVLSFSVTDTFDAGPPDPKTEGWPEADRHAAAWERAVDGLDKSLELAPSDPHKPYYFGSGHTAMSLRAAARP